MNRQIERKPYSSDLSDAAWEWIAPLLAQPSGPGRPRTVDMREIANAIFYLDKWTFADFGGSLCDAVEGQSLNRRIAGARQLMYRIRTPYSASR